MALSQDVVDMWSHIWDPSAPWRGDPEVSMAMARTAGPGALKLSNVGNRVLVVPLGAPLPSHVASLLTSLSAVPVEDANKFTLWDESRVRLRHFSWGSGCVPLELVPATPESITALQRQLRDAELESEGAGVVSTPGGTGGMMGDGGRGGESVLSSLFRGSSPPPRTEGRSSRGADGGWTRVAPHERFVGVLGVCHVPSVSDPGEAIKTFFHSRLVRAAIHGPRAAARGEEATPGPHASLPINPDGWRGSGEQVRVGMARWMGSRPDHPLSTAGLLPLDPWAVQVRVVALDMDPARPFDTTGVHIVGHRSGSRSLLQEAALLRSHAPYLPPSLAWPFLPTKQEDGGSGESRGGDGGGGEEEEVEKEGVEGEGERKGKKDGDGEGEVESGLDVSEEAKQHAQLLPSVLLSFVFSEVAAGVIALREQRLATLLAKGSPPRNALLQGGPYAVSGEEDGDGDGSGGGGDDGRSGERGRRRITSPPTLSNPTSAARLSRVEGGSGGGGSGGGGGAGSGGGVKAGEARMDLVAVEECMLAGSIHDAARFLRATDRADPGSRAAFLLCAEASALLQAALRAPSEAHALAVPFDSLPSIELGSITSIAVSLEAAAAGAWSSSTSSSFSSDSISSLPTSPPPSSSSSSSYSASTPSTPTPASSTTPTTTTTTTTTTSSTSSSTTAASTSSTPSTADAWWEPRFAAGLRGDTGAQLLLAVSLLGDIGALSGSETLPLALASQTASFLTAAVCRPVEGTASSSEWKREFRRVGHVSALVVLRSVPVPSAGVLRSLARALAHLSNARTHARVAAEVAAALLSPRIGLVRGAATLAILAARTLADAGLRVLAAADPRDVDHSTALRNANAQPSVLLQQPRALLACALAIDSIPLPGAQQPTTSTSSSLPLPTRARLALALSLLHKRKKAVSATTASTPSPPGDGGDGDGGDGSGGEIEGGGVEEAVVGEMGDGGDDSEPSIALSAVALAAEASAALKEGLGAQLRLNRLWKGHVRGKPQRSSALGLCVCEPRRVLRGIGRSMGIASSLLRSFWEAEAANGVTTDDPLWEHSALVIGTNPSLEHLGWLLPKESRQAHVAAGFVTPQPLDIPAIAAIAGSLLLLSPQSSTSSSPSSHPPSLSSPSLCTVQSPLVERNMHREVLLEQRLARGTLNEHNFQWLERKVLETKIRWEVGKSYSFSAMLRFHSPLSLDRVRLFATPSATITTFSDAVDESCLLKFPTIQLDLADVTSAKGAHIRFPFTPSFPSPPPSSTLAPGTPLAIVCFDFIDVALHDVDTPLFVVRIPLQSSSTSTPTSLEANIVFPNDEERSEESGEASDGKDKLVEKEEGEEEKVDGGSDGGDGGDGMDGLSRWPSETENAIRATALLEAGPENPVFVRLGIAAWVCDGIPVVATRVSCAGSNDWLRGLHLFPTLAVDGCKLIPVSEGAPAVLEAKLKLRSEAHAEFNFMRPLRCMSPSPHSHSSHGSSSGDGDGAADGGGEGVEEKETAALHALRRMCEGSVSGKLFLTAQVRKTTDGRHSTLSLASSPLPSSPPSLRLYQTPLSTVIHSALSEKLETGAAATKSGAVLILHSIIDPESE